MWHTRLLSVTTGFIGSLVFTASSYTQPIEPHWDTIYTGPPGTQFVTLAVSNFGEIGQAGAGGVNMDFTACGLECGTRHADSVYLYSASPFLLESDPTYTDITLTCSYGQAATRKPYAWVPVEFDWDQVRSGIRCYIENIVPHGKFVSPDGHFAAELYHVDGACPWYECNGVSFLTRVYAIDGQAHPHVTLGWVMDWNIPSDELDSNLSRVDEYGEEYYFQGTDSTNSQACLSGARRYASSSFSYAFKGPLNQHQGFDGWIWEKRTLVGRASLLDDVATPKRIDLLQPDAAAWWNLIGTQDGISIADSIGDLAVWHSAIYDYTVNNGDTIYFWTTLATSYDGDSSSVYSALWLGEGQICNAVDCTLDCPWGRVGDANGSYDEEPTIGDVTTLIDAKFITGSCNGVIGCLGEADINRSGSSNTTCDDITIGDITMLIDYLFITGPSLELPCCSDLP